MYIRLPFSWSNYLKLFRVPNVSWFWYGDMETVAHFLRMWRESHRVLEYILHLFCLSSFKSFYREESMAFCCLTVSGKFGFCHGLGIVDSNELNSYLDYCSYRREYRIWGRKGKRNPSIGRKGVLSIGRATALILCLFERQRLLILASMRRWTVTASTWFAHFNPLWAPRWWC